MATEIETDPRIYSRIIDGSESDTLIPVEVVETDADLYWHMAHHMYQEISKNNLAGRDTPLICPVGPVFQYRRFARLCAEQPLDLSRVHWFFMDEYLNGPQSLIPADDPLSFRGFIDRELLERLPENCGIRREQVYFPDPVEPERYDDRLYELGNARVCYAGVGINGHVAFNEPPEDGEEVTERDFRNRPTRVLGLSRETITVNSNTALGGAFEQVPPLAVTVGMKQIYSADRIRLYFNRPWQKAVIRKLLYGPVGAHFPVSLLRDHRDIRIVATAEVAQRPEFALR